MIPRPTPARRGFTLIELLAVIAIIGLLAGMVLGLAGYVKNSKAEAKARGDIALLRTKLEEFKTRNGEYPIPESNSEQDAEAALFNALTGRWTYKTVNGVRQWNKSNASDPDSRRPLVQDNEVGTEKTFDADRTPTKFIDPWGNAYRYRYGKLTSGKVDTTWNNPGYLLISAGAKISAKVAEIDGGSVPDSDFFMGSEATTGIIGSGTDDAAYFEDQYRADNLTNFGTK